MSERHIHLHLYTGAAPKAPAKDAVSPNPVLQTAPKPVATPVAAPPKIQKVQNMVSQPSEHDCSCGGGKSKLRLPTAGKGLR